MGLSSVTSINFLVSMAIMSTVELESKMTSVERIQYYSEQVPQERHEGAVPAAGWPQQGVVKFEDVSFRSVPGGLVAWLAVWMYACVYNVRVCLRLSVRPGGLVAWLAVWMYVRVCISLYVRPSVPAGWLHGWLATGCPGGLVAWLAVWMYVRVYIRVSSATCLSGYRAKLPLVLRQVNFQTRPCEKVGVVGRTGAGKSSLLVVLFRLVELGHPTGSGRILLDGVDIATVQLNLLRQHIAIIPQDPVLFSGTLRYNLDLAMTHQDAEIWAVLGHIHLRDFVTGLKDKLDTQITEGGTNLSVGQRQLLCLGRALLHSSRVVVMDEATASVDVETDVAIQRTIRECFADRTVIIIAHRINTVMGCDRVMVMDQGQVAEFDQPQTLIDDPNSRFSGIVRSLNQVAASAAAPIASTPVPSPSPVPAQ
ncbi:putative Multidrug resistance-associated protein 5 [Paratrimastix pyriformis]|uniref:Multidrug resistance-associated protein 5 n=1 Tax=Paratrimastix pyriformis TaxID=342808 RepID=A0ABQ8UJI5_9EUKA|nr:putative Multidrug resistance-associated protein 5 [Paratrimastix pyriformis]